MLRERSVPQKGRPGTRIVAGRALPSSGLQLGGMDVCVEYPHMRLAQRQQREAAPVAPGVRFAGWLVAQFLPGGTPGTSFAGLEAASSKAASLFLGAAAAGTGVLDGIAPATPAQAAEARTLARRTADNLRSALADAGHSVVAWPWAPPRDHGGVGPDAHRGGRQRDVGRGNRDGRGRLCAAAPGPARWGVETCGGLWLPGLPPPGLRRTCAGWGLRCGRPGWRKDHDRPGLATSEPYRAIRLRACKDYHGTSGSRLPGCPQA